MIARLGILLFPFSFSQFFLSLAIGDNGYGWSVFCPKIWSEATKSCIWFKISLNQFSNVVSNIPISGSPPKLCARQFLFRGNYDDGKENIFQIFVTITMIGLVEKRGGAHAECDCLCYNNVRSGGKHCKGCDNGEQGEGDQAEPVQHHRSKLPVVLRRRRLVVVPDLVGDNFDLFENQGELAVNPRWEYWTRWLLHCW